MSHRDISVIKRRLDPRLDQPYFTVPSDGGGCSHRGHGVELRVLDRVVVCQGCRKAVDAFDALVNFARDEQRLVGTLERIEDHHRREEERKAADKARRPWARKVLGRRAVRDLSLKAEPVTGHVLTLECGHEVKCGPERIPRQVTCRTCERAATTTLVARRS